MPLNRMLRNAPTNVPIPNVTNCESASNILCTVLSPLNNVTCDRLTAPISKTCPATSELLVAFLKYNGRFFTGHHSVFVMATCYQNEYFAGEVQIGEGFEFRSRGIASDSSSDVLFTIYSSDPREIKFATAVVELSRSVFRPHRLPGPLDDRKHNFPWIRVGLLR